MAKSRPEEADPYVTDNLQGLLDFYIGDILFATSSENYELFTCLNFALKGSL